MAKVEKPAALACLEGIIAESDGIMVARGDLGVELPAEEVPVQQSASSPPAAKRASRW